MKSYKNFVNGKMVAAVEGQEEPIISPVNEEVIARVPKGTEKDVDRAVVGGGRCLREVVRLDARRTAA